MLGLRWHLPCTLVRQLQIPAKKPMKTQIKVKTDGSSAKNKWCYMYVYVCVCNSHNVSEISTKYDTHVALYGWQLETK